MTNAARPLRRRWLPLGGTARSHKGAAYSWVALAAALVCATSTSHAAAFKAVLLVPAEQPAGPTYRVGFKNFEVITRYNRSVRYAMAVHDLATTIAQRVDERDAAAKPGGQPAGTAAR